MPDSSSQTLGDRYQELIEQIVQTTLKGQIRSKEQVYQMLMKEVSPGTGEIFERSLAEQVSATKQQVDTQKDELKLAKATRSYRALQTIQGEWERWQKENRVSGVISSVVQKIITAEATQRLEAVLNAIDTNQPQVLTLEQLQQLALALKQQAEQHLEPEVAREVQQISQGLTRGLAAWQRLEDHLISWMYEQNRGPLGFGGVPGQQGPWALWAKKVNSPLPQALFHTLAMNQSVIDLVAHQAGVELSAWIELAVMLQCLQRGLVTWFDKQAYDTKAGSTLSISTFLTFIAIWCELANGFNQAISSRSRTYRYGDGAFQVTLQILRTFTQREYFPLYGGVFASFAGNYLRDTLNYLDQPLRQVEGTQEKARILTLLGYSQRAQGHYQQATEFHQQALEIARAAGDRACEIANFNHLSRLCVAQKNFAEAINYSQRALIFSRQAGDKLGEVNALANLGYSEVFQAQQLERMEPEVYEAAINYLEQGLKLSESLGDSQSRSLCYSSLGIAHVVLEQPQTALNYLTEGWKAAQASGDLYLQGLNLAYLAEVYYGLTLTEKAVGIGCLSMYLLEQIGANEWRQPAGLLTILQGKMGEALFQTTLQQNRSELIAAIGVDGYDHIPQLLEQYKRSLH
jgi:tetratricopeptide (TPR) repeat protein